MPCRALINGTEYILPHDGSRIVEERIRMAIGGHEVTLSVRVNETGHTADLHLMPNGITSYAVFEEH